MSVTNVVLIQARFALDAIEKAYTAPTRTTAIIDKFTATNTDGVNAQTLTVHLVPSGNEADGQNVITSSFSIGAGKSVDLPEMKNHVLEPGDFIATVASASDKVVIRASGREVK